ncbi:MAG: hypothetical protein AAF671_10000, partial [Pseudomonadota bacterium]
DELTRLRYLHAMGMTPLVSRRRVPGSAPLQRLALRSTLLSSASAPGNASADRKRIGSDSGSNQRGRSDPEQSSQKTQKSATAAELTEATTASAPGLKPKPASIPPPPAPERAPVVEFSLAAFVCAGRLWVEELPENLIQQDQRSLVAMMGVALSHPEVVERTAQVYQFDWPLHKNSQLDLSEAEATLALESFLRRQIENHQCSELICLGEGAVRRVAGFALDINQTAIPSTIDMIRNPERKRDAWLALRG